MLERIKAFFRTVLVPEPELFDVPSFEKRGMSMGFIVNSHLGINEVLPRCGDVIIELTSCSMGMTISKDQRHRVIDVTPVKVNGAGDRQYHQAITSRSDGKMCRFLTAELRSMTDRPRTWITVV